MPGIEKRLARYPQLYSRVGFVHRGWLLVAQGAAVHGTADALLNTRRLIALPLPSVVLQAL